jgi:integrase
MWFAIDSTRRQAEICRLEAADNNRDGRTGLVRDAKHPRHKMGNHQRFRYTPKAWDIMEVQPKHTPFIFPYDPRSISSAFTEACHLLGIVDLHFHDLRHEGISRLFEEGYDLHDVPLFTLHLSWDELKRYTHLRPETMREIVTLPDGSRVIRISAGPPKTLQSPPAEDLIPPMTRRSRSKLFRTTRQHMMP